MSYSAITFRRAATDELSAADPGPLADLWLNRDYRLIGHRSQSWIQVGEDPDVVGRIDLAFRMIGPEILRSI